MDGETSLDLGLLLHAPDVAAREAAWESLIARHTRLLLSVARSFGGGHDAAMERYSFILEKLRERDFHRLRVFKADGRARFSTWLTVAARRLCLDHYRSVYGRSRAAEDDESAAIAAAARRRLADSIGAPVDTDQLPDQAATSDEATVHAQRDAALHTAIAQLSPREQLLLTLRFEDDLSAARIASVLGLSTPFHVYRLLNSALARLRRSLLSRGIENADG